MVTKRIYLYVRYITLHIMYTKSFSCYVLILRLGVHFTTANVERRTVKQRVNKISYFK